MYFGYLYIISNCCEKPAVIIGEYYNIKKIMSNIKFNMISQCVYIYKNK
jgi:hypothetical protein